MLGAKGTPYTRVPGVCVRATTSVGITGSNKTRPMVKQFKSIASGTAKAWLTKTNLSYLCYSLVKTF